MKEYKWSLISKAGNVVNEDIAYADEKMGWVLDAATGLTKNRFTSKESDGQWLVLKWNEYLKENLKDITRSISDIVQEGIGIIEKEFYNECQRAFIEPIERPSASIIIIRIKESKLEYFSLGDCTLLIRDINNNVIKVKDTKLEKLDSKAIDIMSKVRCIKKLTFVEARKEINDTLIKHRLMKNTEEGYWTLEFEKKAINYSFTGELNLKEIKNLALMSDGYSALFDLYNYCNEKELFDYVEKNGVEKGYEKIREIEEEDTSISKYPRFKKGDDSSIVFYQQKNITVDSNKKI